MLSPSLYVCVSFSRFLWLFMVFQDPIRVLHFLKFYFCEKCHWNFDRDCVESVYDFGQLVILIILVLSMSTEYLSIYLYLLPFLSLMFYRFQYIRSRSFTSLVKFISRYFIIFDAIINEIVSFIFF